MRLQSAESRVRSQEPQAQFGSEWYRFGRSCGKKTGHRSAPARWGTVLGQTSQALSLLGLLGCAFLAMREWLHGGGTYAEILALAPQQAHSLACLAISSPLPRFERLGMSETVRSVVFLMQESCSLRAFSVFWVTLPRSQEQRFGALFGAGQKGTGSAALGHTAKYCWTKSWYSHE